MGATGRASHPMTRIINSMQASGTSQNAVQEFFLEWEIRELGLELAHGDGSTVALLYTCTLAGGGRCRRCLEHMYPGTCTASRSLGRIRRFERSA